MTPTCFHSVKEHKVRQIQYIHELYIFFGCILLIAGLNNILFVLCLLGCMEITGGQQDTLHCYFVNL